MSDYTHGEIRALIAPLLKFDPEHLHHYVIIGQDDTGRLRSIGCSHELHLLQGAISKYPMSKLIEDGELP